MTKQFTDMNKVNLFIDSLESDGYKFIRMVEVRGVMVVTYIKDPKGSVSY